MCRYNANERLASRRPQLDSYGRLATVGFKPKDDMSKITGGAHFLDLNAKPSLEADLGHMMSVAYSPILKSWIGLGILKNGRARLGEYVRSVDFMRGTDIVVEVCDPVFFDPNGERLRG